MALWEKTRNSRNGGTSRGHAGPTNFMMAEHLWNHVYVTNFAKAAITYTEEL